MSPEGRGLQEKWPPKQGCGKGKAAQQKASDHRRRGRAGRRHRRLHILVRAPQRGAHRRCLYRRQRDHDGSQGIRLRRRAQHQRQHARDARASLLLRIDPRDYLDRASSRRRRPLELAQAQLKSAQERLRIARVQYPAQLDFRRAQQQAAAASLEQARRQYPRQHEVDRRATTQENIDTSTSQQLSAAANLKSAKAQVADRRAGARADPASLHCGGRAQGAARAGAGAARAGRSQCRLHRGPRAERRLHHACAASSSAIT